MTDQKMMPIVADALELREKITRCKTSDAQMRASRRLDDLFAVMNAAARAQYKRQVQSR